MPAQVVDLWEIVRIIITVSVPFLVVWLKIHSDERQRTMDRRFSEFEKYFQVEISSIKSQAIDIRNEVRDGRLEAREGRKECSEDVRAIAAQMSEYPRRREMQEAVSEIWRTIRPRRGDE
jgi:hypothetical protein